MPSRLGIDIGVADADFLLLDDETGATHALKLSGAPDALPDTISRGVRELAGRAGIQAGEIATVVGGVGAVAGDDRTGLLVTRGFEHVLHLGRGRSDGTAPAARLDLTEGVAERMSADGNTMTLLDEAAAARSVNRLVQAGVRALAVCLVNAQANPAHERRLREIARGMAGDIPVVLSHEVAPEAGEYERALATVIAAGRADGLQRRLDAVNAGLQAAEISPRLEIAGSGGGRSGAETPIGVIGASQAGAAAAAARIAAAAGFADALVLDLGGAAANAALVRGGMVRVSDRTAFGADSIPQAALDVRRIGGGSRTVASVPFTGAISLDAPESGPGPSVADANIVLGRVPGAGGSDRAAAAEQAVAEFAARAGLDRHRAAEGIVEIFEERLAGALRLAAVARGEDPERMALVACGGAGPMHGCAIGVATGCVPVIVPHDAGALAALGFATARRSRQFAQAVGRTLDRLSAHDVADHLDGLRARAEAWLGAEGMAAEVTFRADLRVHRGRFRMSTAIDPAGLSEPGGLSVLAGRIDEAHRRRFGLAPAGPVEIVALRALADAAQPAPVRPPSRLGAADPRSALADQMQTWFDGAFTATSVFRRDRLQPGNRMLGPALVSQPGTTTVIAPGHAGEVDAGGNILIRPIGRGADGS